MTHRMKAIYGHFTPLATKKRPGFMYVFPMKKKKKRKNNIPSSSGENVRITQNTLPAVCSAVFSLRSANLFAKKGSTTNTSLELLVKREKE